MSETGEITATDEELRRMARDNPIIAKAVGMGDGWKIGFNEGLEAAAQVAGEKSAMLPHQNDFDRGYANGRADAAAAIRALKQKD